MANILKSTLGAAATLLFFAGSASSGELAEQKAWEAADKTMGTYTTQAKRKCGFDLPYTFDKTTFKDVNLEKTRPASFCSYAYVAIEDLCRDAASKAAVQKKVTQVVCRYDAATKTPAVSLDGTKLVFAGNPDLIKGSSPSAAIRDWLKKTL